jgi:hypothetical protein
MQLVGIVYEVNQKEKTVAVICDCCGQNIPKDDLESRVVGRASASESENRWAETYDICSACWERHVIPIFRTGPFRLPW